MGWSCNVAASLTLDEIKKAMDALGETSGNGLRDSAGRSVGFWEISRTEHDDGAITGTCWRYLPGGQHIRRAGSFRIEGNGKVTRFPMIGPATLRLCEKAGAVEFARRHVRTGTNG
jgi:hypothetical protein